MNLRTSSALLASVLVVVGCARLGLEDDDGSTKLAKDPADCSTRVIDAGQKSNVNVTGRGRHSDVAAIPGSGYPALAYTDSGSNGTSGSLVVKFAYWDGSQYRVEAISGDYAATFVQLAFLPDGTPVIAYATGTSVIVAMRGSAVPPAGGSASAAWSSSVVDSFTGWAPRALRMAVSPRGDVALVYVNRASAGKHRFAYCAATCAGPSGFQVMTAGAAPIGIEPTLNSVTNPVQTGVAWCRKSGAAPYTYYPAVAYSTAGTNAVRFAACRQSSLSSCLSSAGWTIWSNITGTTSVSVDLHLDPEAPSDTPKVAALGAAGVVTYGSVGACDGTTAAFTAGNTLGGATTGNLWLRILKDAAGRWHALANLSTTGVRYFNTVGTPTETEFNSAAVGTWNAAGIVENAALYAGGGGGAALDPGGSQVVAAYGLNVSPYSIRLAHALHTSSSAATAFTAELADQSGNLQVGQANLQVRNIAMGRTSTGRPAVAYVDFSATNANTGGRLKFAYRNGDSADSSWSVVVLPGAAQPQFPSLAFDHLDRPWVGFFDRAINRYSLMTAGSSDGSGTWTAYAHPHAPSGVPAALPAANGTALAMRASAGVRYPVMGVIDTNATSKSVKVAQFNSGSSTWGPLATLTSAGFVTGSNISGAGDRAGNVAFAFRDLTNNKVYYAASSDGTVWSAPLGISAVNRGAGLSLRVNPVSLSPLATYYDRASNLLRAAACAGTLTSCATSGWSSTTVDSGVGVSTLAVGNEQVLSSGVVFEPDGTLNVVYPRGQTAGGSLILSRGDTPASLSPNIIASSPAAGLSGSPALNFAVAGWNARAVRNAKDGITAAYIGPGNYLYATSCRD